MRIKAVHIENFRSIKVVDFHPGAYSLLIGENNSGKSNILRALNLVLGDAWPSERSFSDDDFHGQDTSKDIVIRVLFDSPWDEWANKTVTIGGFELTCKAYKRRVGEKPAGSLKTDFVCVDPTGAPITCPSEPLKKGERSSGRWLPLLVSSERRQRVPFIYIDVFREYDQHTPSGRWSVLRRLFDDVNRQLQADKTEIVVQRGEGPVKMTRKAAFEATVKDAYAYLRSPEFVNVETTLARHALAMMGLSADEGQVNLAFHAHDSRNAYKTLELFVTQLGIETSAGDVGAGLQSAIVVAIFRTFQELKKTGATFAIEEPEVFLHPHMARYLSRILRTLAEGGNQVFATTHSPSFVQIHDPESVVRVRRNRDVGTTVHQASLQDLAADARQTLRLMSEFDAQRNEMLFAKRVLFVEGGTEKIAVPLMLRALGFDLDLEGISVVDCGGKNKVPFFVRIVEALRIPYVVLADEDTVTIDPTLPADEQAKVRQKNEVHERANRAIQQVVQNGRTIFLSPTFEAVCDLTGGDREKIDQALERFTGSSPPIPEPLKAVADALRAV